MLDRVVEYRSSGTALTRELKEWVRDLFPHRLRELVKLGVVNSADLGQKPLADMVEEYKAHLKALDRTPSHVQHTVHSVKECIEGMAAVRLADFEESRVVRHLRELRKTLAAATVNHYLVSLKSFVAWAVRRGYASDDPIHNVRRLNVAVEGVTFNRRALTDKEINKLLAHTQTVSVDRYWLYRFALETGLRRGEIAGLTIANVDLKTGWVLVPAAYSRKVKRNRRVPLASGTCRELKAYWKGKSPSARAFRVAMRTAEHLAEDMKAAGLNPAARGMVVDFHSLRHTYATRAGMQTDTFADLMELLGHKTPAMTARYAHAESDRLKAVAERLAQ